MAEFLTYPPALFLLVLGFAFVIFVHELGHFLVAKAVGIKCTQFAIGFGPAMLAWRKGIGFRRGSTESIYRDRIMEEANRRQAQRERTIAQPKEKTAADRIFTEEELEQVRQELGLGETEYRLNYLPLGGYVKMLGQEDMDPTAQSSNPRAFNRKPAWARACVITAGVTMNLIFAVIFFIVAFMNGVKFPAPIVGSILPYSPASGVTVVDGKVNLVYADNHPNDPNYLGLKLGDSILRVNGAKVNDFSDIMVPTALGHPDQAIVLDIERPTQSGVELLTYRIKPVKNEATGLLYLGIEMPNNTRLAEFANEDDLPKSMKAAGIKSGMRAIAADENTIEKERYDQLYYPVVAAKGAPVKVTFEDEKTGKTVSMDIAAWALGVKDPKNKETPRSLLGLVPAVSIQEVMPKSPADEAELKPGDQILALNDVSWPCFERIVDTLKGPSDQEIRLSLWRGDERFDPKKPVKPRSGKLGFVQAFSGPFRISGTLETAPQSLRDLNLPAGTLITALNDKPVETFSQAQAALQTLATENPKGFEVAVQYQLWNSKKLDQVAVRVDAEQAKQIADARWEMPFTFNPFEPLRKEVSAGTPFAATQLGLIKTKQFMVQTYLTLARLFQGTVPANQLRGPIGIAEIGTQVTRTQGWPYLLFFLGLISVNLVVVNFLPMPIVDGGLMVFLIIEKIKGSPVSPKVLAAANWVGLALIGSLMLMTLYFDVSRLLGMS